MTDAPRIFISYRRDDSAGSTGRLYDRLAQDFPAESLFIDVDAIAPGVDFVAELEHRVQSCDVLLAIIGRSWQTASDKAGRPRLEDPTDFVRLEVATALRGGIRVIPVLVDGATMPVAERLPPDLQPLLRRNALEVTHHRFATDVNRLVRALAPSGAIPAARPSAPIVVPSLAPPVAQASVPPNFVSLLRLVGLSATLVAIIGSSAILATVYAREGSGWWMEHVPLAGQIWAGFAVLAGPGIAARLWLPRLTMAHVWGILGANFAGLTAMIALQLVLQLLLPADVPRQPQTAAENLLWMGYVELPVMLGTGLALGYFLAQTMRGYFPDDGGPGFTRRMIVIWMATGTAYAVATFLLVSIGEAAALRGPSGAAAAARLQMRMWSDTVLFGLAWALGWILTLKLAGKRKLA